MSFSAYCAACVLLCFSNCFLYFFFLLFGSLFPFVVSISDERKCVSQFLLTTTTSGGRHHRLLSSSLSFDVHLALLLCVLLILNLPPSPRCVAPPKKDERLRHLFSSANGEEKETDVTICAAFAACVGSHYLVSPSAFPSFRLLSCLLSCHSGTQ